MTKKTIDADAVEGMDLNGDGHVTKAEMDMASNGHVTISICYCINIIPWIRPSS